MFSRAQIERSWREVEELGRDLEAARARARSLREDDYRSAEKCAAIDRVRALEESLVTAEARKRELQDMERAWRMSLPRAPEDTRRIRWRV